jgi:transcriptional regulator with XRE-family HTH domain
MSRTPPQLSPTPTLQERFGRNLWRCRRRADLSQEDLANLVGLSRDAISSLEKGERLARLDTIVMLAAGTDASPCVLLAGWSGVRVATSMETSTSSIPHAALRRTVGRLPR